MYYEINVALEGKHLFATSERSIRDRMTLYKVFDTINKKFPSSEGYNISVKRNDEVFNHLSKEDLTKEISNLKKLGAL